ncbi:MAG: hypothetical protein KGQ52_13300 [Alphaproteobacteria bacterium]|nr:hypothetical protein [Alphaproteobacteria bacterium]
MIEFDYSAVAMWGSFNMGVPRIWWLPSVLISFDRTWRGWFSALVVVSLPHRHAGWRRQIVRMVRI